MGVDLPLDLPPGLPELSEYKSISMNLKLLFSGAVDVPPGLPELSEYESISMHTQNIYVQIFKLFQTLLLYKLTFFIFCQGELSKHPKISHFVDFDWEKCIEMA